MLETALAVGQGLSMIGGWFGSNRAKRKEQEKIGRLKGISAGFQSQYIGAAGNIDKKYSQLGDFQYEGNQLQGLLDLNEYSAGVNQFDSMVGRSNMADIAGQQRGQMEQAYKTSTEQRLLSNKASAFDLQESAAGEFREVQMGLLGLRERAAQSGFTLGKSSFDLQSYLNRGYV